MVQEYVVIGTEEILVTNIKPSQVELDDGGDWFIVVTKSQKTQVPFFHIQQVDYN